ncbi:MAG: hypothetical protein SGBAC_003415 [Bacillariaceae sp.]
MSPHNPTKNGNDDSSSEEENVPDEISGVMFNSEQPQAVPSMSFPDDDDSGEIREYTGQFEGPEKTLEVCFRKKDLDGPAVTKPGEKAGLRRLTLEQLGRICARARCTILSSVSNQYLDAYVLSESSLFIYPYMLVLKTCGTTTLLRCMALLIEFGRQLGLEIDWVGYSRKNFNFPTDQAFPHQSFHQELEYLYSHRNLCETLDGNGYSLGPLTSDHWFVFVADQTIRSRTLEVDTDRVLNMMMFDIDEDIGKLFQYDHYEKMEGEEKEDETKRISREQTLQSGITSLCPGAVIDPRAFEPCGYSMNAILFRSYSTIHITPESGSSYVSFETNQKVASYKSLISNVISTFRPKRFVMTLMADEAGLKQLIENPFTGSGQDSSIVTPVPPEVSKATGIKHLMYKRGNVASIQVEDDCCCMMGNWVLKTDISPQQIRASKARGMTIT